MKHWIGVESKYSANSLQMCRNLINLYLCNIIVVARGRVAPCHGNDVSIFHHSIAFFRFLPMAHNFAEWILHTAIILPTFHSDYIFKNPILVPVSQSPALHSIFIHVMGSWSGYVTKLKGSKSKNLSHETWQNPRYVTLRIVYQSSWKHRIYLIRIWFICAKQSKTCERRRFIDGIDNIRLRTAFEIQDHHVATSHKFK